MILLQSFDKFAELGLLDAAKGTLSKVLKDHRRDLCGLPIQGHFARLGEEDICLFRERGRLLLLVKGTTLDFDDAITVEVLGASRRTLSVYRNERLAVELAYTVSDMDALIWHVDPFAEEEDYEFGVFLRQRVF